MKKFAAIFLITILASHAVYSQKLSFGIKPSLLILDSKYIEKPSTFGLNLSSRISYGYGITVKSQLSKLFSLQIEPRLMAKGYNVSFGDGVYDIYKNNYLSLPTLIFFHPLKNLNIEIGPEFAYLIDSKTRQSPNGSFHSYKSSDRQHFELSLISGLSYSFLKRFDFGIRYGIALTPYQKGKLLILEDPYPSGYFSNINYKIYNRYFEFYLNTRIFSDK